MKNLACLLLALAACSKAESHTQQQPPAPVAVAPPTEKVAPKKVLQPSDPPTFIRRVNSIAADHRTNIDASALGAAVDVTLVERVGLAFEDDQSIDIDLVLSSPTGQRVIFVSTYEASTADSTAPFGVMRALPSLPAPRPFAASTDALPGASKFPSKAPLLFAHPVLDSMENQQRILVAHERDALVVYFADLIQDRSSKSSAWTKKLTVKLAANTRVKTPALGAGELMRSLDPTFEVREQIISTHNGNQGIWFDLVADVGRGPIGGCTSKEAPFTGERVWTASPVENPPPTTGRIVATRTCVAGPNKSTFVLEHRSEHEQVFWMRQDDEVGPGEWHSTTL